MPAITFDGIEKRDLKIKCNMPVACCKPVRTLVYHLFLRSKNANKSLLLRHYNKQKAWICIFAQQNANKSLLLRHYNKRKALSFCEAKTQINPFFSAFKYHKIPCYPEQSEGSFAVGTQKDSSLACSFRMTRYFCIII